MDRKILGLHKDGEGDWVAELECFHDQHVRHNSPFFNRSWTTTDKGRESMLGQPIECGRCLQLEWPEGLESLRCTPRFDENSIPRGLQKDHSTKAGVWGLIHVVSGQLRYVCQTPVEREMLLDADSRGIIPPGLLHDVEAQGDVCFYVDFLRGLASN